MVRLQLVSVAADSHDDVAGVGWGRRRTSIPSAARRPPTSSHHVGGAQPLGGGQVAQEPPPDRRHRRRRQRLPRVVRLRRGTPGCRSSSVTAPSKVSTRHHVPSGPSSPAARPAWNRCSNGSPTILTTSTSAPLRMRRSRWPSPPRTTTADRHRRPGVDHEPAAERPRGAVGAATPSSPAPGCRPLPSCARRPDRPGWPRSGRPATAGRRGRRWRSTPARCPAWRRTRTPRSWRTRGRAWPPTARSADVMNGFSKSPPSSRERCSTAGPFRTSMVSTADQSISVAQVEGAAAAEVGEQPSLERRRVVDLEQRAGRSSPPAGSRRRPRPRSRGGTRRSRASRRCTACGRSR